MEILTLEGLDLKYDMNIDNSILEKDTSDYNCMGFALGTYNWAEIVDFLGYEDGCSGGETEEDRVDPDIFGEDIYGTTCLSDMSTIEYDWNSGEEDISYTVNYPTIRHLGNWETGDVPSDTRFSDMLQEGERLIAMRVADEDFHFVRKMPDGKWYQKMGRYDITDMTNEELFSNSWESFLGSNLYVGPIAFFGIKEAA